MIEQTALLLAGVFVGYFAHVAWKRYRRWWWVRKMSKAMMPALTLEPRAWFTLDGSGRMVDELRREQNAETRQFKLDLARLAMSIPSPKEKP